MMAHPGVCAGYAMDPLDDLPVDDALPRGPSAVDRIIGWKTRALDDYLAKPFLPRETHGADRKRCCVAAGHHCGRPHPCADWAAR